MVALRYAARSDIGLGRRNNQDSGYAGTNLLVVADGMGGHAGGDVASSLAVSQLAVLDNDAPGADALQELEQAIHHAAETIRERALDEPNLAGMGTTVTAILRHGNRLALAHIGDSRAYLLRDGEFTQVTVDHTFVQKLVDDGKISAEEATQHPQRNVVMRVIGDVDAPEAVDTSVREAAPGDRWLLCSDGLSGPVSQETMAETLAEIADPAACADKLVDLALRAGGSDNITCIVADVVRENQAEASTSPQVVGAAATSRLQPTKAPGDSAAAKAAALTRPIPTGDDDEYAEVEETGHGSPLRAIVSTIVVAVIILAGLYGAWVWSQRQFFVGVSDGKVAIYSGLSSDIGPLKMSSLYERKDNLPVDTLDTSSQEKVRAGIGADDLADARRIVANLYGQSSVCTPTVMVVPSGSTVPSTLGTQRSPTPSSPTPTTGSTPVPTVSGSPGPSQTVTLPVPSECGAA